MKNVTFSTHVKVTAYCLSPEEKFLKRMGNKGKDTLKLCQLKSQDGKQRESIVLQFAISYHRETAEFPCIEMLSCRHKKCSKFRTAMRRLKKIILYNPQNMQLINNMKEI